MHANYSQNSIQEGYLVARTEFQPAEMMYTAEDTSDRYTSHDVGTKSTSTSQTPQAQATSIQDYVADETSLLLSRENGKKNGPSRPVARPRKLRSARSIMVVMLLVIVLTSFGDQIKESPETRIMESIICYHHYEKNDPSRIKIGRNAVGPGAIGGVDEKYCKVDSVQDELAMLLGYKNFFDGIPLLVLALPFGWAADRYGRWPFLFLNLIQAALRATWSQIVTWHWQAFNLRMVWLGSALSLLGGGSPVASSLFFVVISDVTPHEERAATFLRAGAVDISANLIMPLLAAALMEFSPWIPYLLGTVFNILAAVFYLLAPETLGYRTEAGPIDDTAELLSGAASAQDVPASFAGRWYSSVKSKTVFLTSDWRVPALISTFLAHILIGNVGRLLLQYCSKRYGLSLSKATLIILVRNGVNVLLLFVVLPYFAEAGMRRFGWCSQLKDLYLARTAQTISAIGWILVAIAPNLPWAASGLVLTSFTTSASLLVRSFLTSILEPHHTGQVYSIIGIVDTLGMMFGAPLLAELFAEGLSLGGFWTGLPFGFIALLATFIAGLLFVVVLRKGEDSAIQDEL